MNSLKSILPSALCALLAACASTPEAPEARAARLQAEGQRRKPKDPSEGWLKGTLTCLEDSAPLPFRIEKKMAWGGSATGGLAATHPVTGERFTGQYTAILSTSRGSTSVRSPSGKWSYGTATATSNTADAIGTLTGDKGTVIQIEMQILAGLTPHGIGTGRDNQGRQYQVQF